MKGSNVSLSPLWSFSINCMASGSSLTRQGPPVLWRLTSAKGYPRRHAQDGTCPVPSNHNMQHPYNRQRGKYPLPFPFPPPSPQSGESLTSKMPLCQVLWEFLVTLADFDFVEKQDVCQSLTVCQPAYRFQMGGDIVE